MNVHLYNSVCYALPWHIFCSIWPYGSACACDGIGFIPYMYGSIARKACIFARGVIHFFAPARIIPYFLYILLCSYERTVSPLKYIQLFLLLYHVHDDMCM